MILEIGERELVSAVRPFSVMEKIKTKWEERRKCPRKRLIKVWEERGRAEKGEQLSWRTGLFRESSGNPVASFREESADIYI